MMDKDKLYQWFAEHNIKSISPSIGLVLVEVMEEINSNLLTIKDDKLHEDLEEYKNALDTVCRTAAIHQKAVIDKLDAFVKES